MLSSKRKRTRATGVLSPIARILVVAFTVSAAGCSADVTRFDLGSKNSTSSIPVPPEPVRSSYGPSATPRGLGLTEAPLPPADPDRQLSGCGPPVRRAAPLLRLLPSARRRPRRRRKTIASWAASTRRRPLRRDSPSRRRNRLPAPNAPFRQPAPDTAGGAIDVQPGETLYSIGRRHGVSVAAIKDANGLSSDAVRPGQRLVMPAGTQDNRAPFGKAPPSSEDRTVVARATPPAGSAGAAQPELQPATHRPAGRAATP